MDWYRKLSRRLAFLRGAGAERSTQSLAALAEKTWEGGGAPEEAPVRVLVADDNAVNQKVAVRMLDTLNARADVAASGREAVDMLRQVRYDLVLMDCQMPGMSGHEAVVEIRRIEGAERRTPVVCMTAGSQNGCRHQCLECGMDDALPKPIRLNALAGVLQRLAPVCEPQQ